MADYKGNIERYLRKYERKGYTLGSLRGMLIQSGYAINDVDSVIRKLESERKKAVKPQKILEKRLKMGTPFENIKFHPNHIVIGILVVLIVASIAWIIVSSLPQGCGYDSECFIEVANKCESASLEQDFAGSTIRFSTDRCTLKKEIIAFAEDEPEEVISFFKGKTMECTYAEGSFDDSLIDGLLGGIDMCEGSLKDSVYELRAAQYLVE